MRLDQQSAYVLHARPYRETSLLLECLTRDQGRLGVVARGVRGERAKLRRAQLEPFQSLALDLLLRGELAASRRAAGLHIPADDIGDVIRTAWQGVDDRSSESVQAFVKRVLADASLWGVDLSVLPQFQQTVATQVSRILSQGALRALDSVLTVGIA